MEHHYWLRFVELIRTPFQHPDLIWGIVPLYFGWLFNELTSAKRSFRTAIQTGFSFLWAGAQWVYQYLQTHPPEGVTIGQLMAVHVVVTALVVLVGGLALVSGFRRKYPPYGAFLGHTRFSNYFMIAIFPMQARYLDWTWERVVAVLLFAFPVWLVAKFGLTPLRKGAQH